MKCNGLFILSFVLFIESGIRAQDQSTQNALDIAQQVVQDFPQNPKSYVVKGHVYRAVSDWNNAIQAFRQALAINPEQSDVMMMIAGAYNKQYKYEQAIEWYTKATAVKNIQRGWYQALGLAFIQLNRMDDAREAFLNEVSHFPKNASSHYYLAQRYFEAGDYESAKKNAKTCMELDERFPEPLYLLASIARKEKENKKAKEYLDQFRKKKAKEGDYVAELEEGADASNSIESHIHLLAGALYFQHNRDQKAEQHFRSVINADAKNIDARINLMQLYTEQKNIHKLEGVVRDLHTLKPNNVEYMQKLGDLLLAKNSWNEAIPILNKAFSISPNTQIKRALSQALLLGQTNPQRGLQLMLEVVQEEPSARHYDILSRAFYVNRDLAQSVEAMRMASELDPQNPTYQQRYNKLKSLKK